MEIVVPKDDNKEERRVPLTPDIVKKLVALGTTVSIESGMGKSLYSDSEYQMSGVSIVTNRQDLFKSGQLVLRLGKPSKEDISSMPAGTCHVSYLDPFRDADVVTQLAEQGVSALCMEMIPRSTIAQKMDALSSQANLAGYVAVILATQQLDKIVPMMMTPAGMLSPARIFIIGAGVAGLQAIATARRLGARVFAFDTRPVVAEQVQSLGAKFVEVDLGDTGQTKDGYAKALTDEQLAIQREAMAEQCRLADVVITTAQLFGRTAPRLIDQSVVKSMKKGAVLVDLAVESGGNIEGSVPGQVVDIDGVSIMGHKNLPGFVPRHASQMYASNLFHVVDHFWDKETKTFKLDLEDPILKGCLITHEGNIVNESLAERLQSERSR